MDCYFLGHALVCFFAQTDKMFPIERKNAQEPTKMALPISQHIYHNIAKSQYTIRQG